MKTLILFLVLTSSAHAASLCPENANSDDLSPTPTTAYPTEDMDFGNLPNGVNFKLAAGEAAKIKMGDAGGFASPVVLSPDGTPLFLIALYPRLRWASSPLPFRFMCEDKRLSVVPKQIPFDHVRPVNYLDFSDIQTVRTQIFRLKTTEGSSTRTRDENGVNLTGCIFEAGTFVKIRNISYDGSAIRLLEIEPITDSSYPAVCKSMLMDRFLTDQNLITKFELVL